MPACYRGALFRALVSRLAPKSKHGNNLSSGDRRILRRRSRGVLAALFAQPMAGIVRTLCGAGADLAPSFEYQLTHGGRRSEWSIKRHWSYFSRKCQDQFRIPNSEFVELRMRRVPDASNSECVECQLSTVRFRSVLVELKSTKFLGGFWPSVSERAVLLTDYLCPPALRERRPLRRSRSRQGSHDALGHQCTTTSSTETSPPQHPTRMRGSAPIEYETINEAAHAA